MELNNKIRKKGSFRFDSFKILFLCVWKVVGHFYNFHFFFFFCWPMFSNDQQSLMTNHYLQCWNNAEDKDWLNSNASWPDMSVFNSFKILVGILLGPSILSRFKEEILETSVLSVGIMESDSIFSSGRYSQYFLSEDQIEVWMFIAALAK